MKNSFQKIKGGFVKLETLDASISEAKRFINKAKIAKERMLKDKYAVYGCSETAAAKRASMDLTRMLANLRLGRMPQ